ncbi:phosphoribosylformylglycinamidine cyclo-ligase [Helicobacter sp. 11S02629-2]|uniref:phosphoribosylformylglycinamidine cyclo-ligase n=1 Tax=Helicobacter sp. 11S02629-2 TaxID=1476195 RepID=UPI000BA6247F|nr:phosphoribosylformylglycinamidine cyclo-ligase [Helicobacter sp. 11S02629-2]PAF45972.1 phosphoribosylformylglycinamidine cyclo-ligase [Helicobacter sp. 11S02629-2]
MDKMFYKDFGVDIDEGNDFVKALSPLAKQTYNDNVVGSIGSFSGAFSMPTGFKDPVLCAATDGVGSKLGLALQAKKLDSIGIDLVAMCVNDLICNFATPMFFLDYYAMHKLEKESALEIIKGIVEGCKLARCALLGGESAEMPSLYKQGDFDLAGFSVGVAERKDMDRALSIEEGDTILAFPSSGFHSNGYSLLQGIMKTKNIGDINYLLTPTRIYVDEFLRYKDRLKALAHITGGGIAENLVRVLPSGKQAIVDKDLIRTPKEFDVYLEHVEEKEAYRVFNMGVGLIVVVSKQESKHILDTSDAYVIGEIQNGEKRVILKGFDTLG